MTNEISRLNRKIKAAAKRLISQDDPKAIGEMIKLAKLREEILKPKKFKKENKDD